MNTTSTQTATAADYAEQIAAANALAAQARQMGLPQVIVQGHLDRARDLFVASLAQGA